MVTLFAGMKLSQYEVLPLSESNACDMVRACRMETKAQLFDRTDFNEVKELSFPLIRVLFDLY